MPLTEKLKEVLARHPEVQLAVLFGSAARDRGFAPRDVDLGLQLDPDEPQRRLLLEAELGRAAARQVDILYLDESPPQLRFEIARSGQVLVERIPYRWSDFKARAMLDWWDWAPWARRIHAASRERLKRETRTGQT